MNPLTVLFGAATLYFEKMKKSLTDCVVPVKRIYPNLPVACLALIGMVPATLPTLQHLTPSTADGIIYSFVLVCIELHPAEEIINHEGSLESVFPRGGYILPTAPVSQHLLTVVHRVRMPRNDGIYTVLYFIIILYKPNQINCSKPQTL